MATSDLRPPKRVRNKQLAVDWFSKLPDEILVHILSFLTLVDAARTSVLSKRWVGFWKEVPELDFSDVNLWVGWLRKDRLSVTPECRGKYVELVNKVLGSHSSNDLDVFKIQFDLGNYFKEDIDNWLQYALSRRVHRLDLNLSLYGVDLCILPSYTISPDLLGLSAGNASAAFLGFKTLRALTLNAVNVSESAVAFFLYNCPFLEDLVVANNGHLKQLQVCGQSLALKRLEVVWCWGLISLIVCDINIVSLKVTNGEKLVLKNVPNLVDVCIGGLYGGEEDLVGNSVSRLSFCLSKLGALTLHISSYQQEMAQMQLGGINDLAHDLLPQLKQLTFVLLPPKDLSLFPFTPLIRASPMLEKFVVKFDQQYALASEERYLRHNVKKNIVRFPLKHLKVVEFCGYMGHRNREMELVRYFVENSVALEKIIVDVQGDSSMIRWPVLRRGERVANSRARQQLLPWIPSNVQLVVL